MAITNDKLVWIYTNYGLKRVTEVMNNPEQQLALTKIIVGDSAVNHFDPNTGQGYTTYDYYTPEPTQEDLVHPLASFYFHGKKIDRETNMVTLITNIPANSSGYMINEMGIYEDNMLIAICTCQPIMKPSQDDNYVISINLNIELHSYNLASIYDRIILNVDSSYIQPSDLEQIQYDILYMEGNLCEQISENSHVIGLNRPEELRKEIIDNKKTMSLSMLTNIYNNLSNLIGYENVCNFWIFDHSRYTSTENNIVDIGYLGEYLSTTEALPVDDVTYLGMCPSFDFTTNNFYTDLSVVDDKDNTYFMILKHNELGKNATILAKSDYALGKHEFEIKRKANNSFEITVFSENGKITYTSDNNSIPDSAYALTVQIPENIKENDVILLVNGTMLVLNKTITGDIDIRNSEEIGYTSYIKDTEGNVSLPTGSKMGLIIRGKGNITYTQLRGLSLMLASLTGINVCMNFR